MAVEKRYAISVLSHTVYWLLAGILMVCYESQAFFLRVSRSSNIEPSFEDLRFGVLIQGNLIVVCFAVGVGFISGLSGSLLWERKRSSIQLPANSAFCPLLLAVCVSVFLAHQILSQFFMAGDWLVDTLDLLATSAVWIACMGGGFMFGVWIKGKRARRTGDSKRR